MTELNASEQVSKKTRDRIYCVKLYKIFTVNKNLAHFNDKYWILCRLDKNFKQRAGR